MSDKALGATLPHSWDPHQNFQSSREELWQPMGYLTGLRASGSSVNKRGGGAAGAHSPSSSQGSPSPREQAERQRAETASQQECRRFLEDWMDPSSTQARSFTVEASASGTQSDVFFHREPGRQARAQRVRHLADDGSFTGRTIFVASPITARASTAFTNSPARRRPAIGVPKSRRELSRALNGGLEPRAQLGPFSPGRQHTNRESAQARRSLRPRMDLRIGTSGRAGGSLTGGAAERHQRDGGRVSWWREGDDVVSGRTEGSWAVPKAAAVRGVQLGRRSAYGRQSVPLPQSSSVDDIAGTDWRELERYWEHTTPFRSRLSISTPLSPARPISRARESFTASDRFVHTQSVRAVKTPDALRRQANWTAPPQPKWTGV